MAFSEDKITKQHILDANAEIDRDGVRKGRQSSTYAIVYLNKNYPPKYVLSRANKYATGEELVPDEFAGGKDTDGFKLLKGFAFEIKRKLESSSLTLTGNIWKLCVSAKNPTPGLAHLVFFQHTKPTLKNQMSLNFSQRTDEKKVRLPNNELW